MRAFGVSADLTIAGRHGRRRLAAARPRDAAGGLDPSSLVLAIHDEDHLIRQALAARQDDTDAELRFYEEAELAAWPCWPTRLGRDPAEPDGAPLRLQVERLRARLPDRRHFRIAVVGGFGFNLGDTVLGATAWRAAATVLADALPSVAATVLLGPSAHPAIATLMSDLPAIDAVRHGPIRLADLSRYDAFFDFTGLIRLPRFHEGAHLDWLLWWLGLDPPLVPATAKRNRLRLPATALAFAESRLATVAGCRVGLVWRASTPLRSMPVDVAAAFARALLEAAPSITLVVDQPLPLDHERLALVEATSAFDMMALVAGLDGLVTIDSLAQHVADSADVPTVLILNTLPPSRFPYYPQMAILTPPGAENLPGWGVTKVAAEAWPAMAEDYARCWAVVSAAKCWSLLAARLEARPASGDRAVVEPFSDAPRAPARIEDPAFAHDRASPLDLWIADEIGRLAAVVLGPGRTAVLAGGDGALALRLAGMVAPDGALHVFEPRRLRAQALAAAAHARGLETLHLHAGVAGAASSSCAIEDFDPRGEADPAAWGNLFAAIEVAAQPLDTLGLADCDLLVVRPPQGWAEALAGASATLAACRPVLLIGPVLAPDHLALREALATIGYVAGLSAPAGSPAADGALLLATPEEMQAAMQGFVPLIVETGPR